MATIATLDERLQTVETAVPKHEERLQQVEGTSHKMIGGLIVVSLFIVAIVGGGAKYLLDHHERLKGLETKVSDQETLVKASADSQEKQHKASFDAQEKHFAHRIGKVEDRLGYWENRGFRMPPQALVLDVKFASLDGDRIVVTHPDGASQEFIASPAQISIAKRLKTGDPIQVMGTPLPEGLAVFKPVK